MKVIIISILFAFLSCSPQEAEVENASVALLSSEEGYSSNFGYTPLNVEKEVFITLKNSGSYDISDLKNSGFNEGSAFSFKGGEYPGTGGTCNDSLQTNSICQIVVEFAPTSSGHWEEVLKFSYLDGISQTSKSFIFTGIAGQIPSLEFTTDDASFGILESFDKKTKTITLTNTGGLPVNDLKFNINKNGQIDFLGGSFPGTGGTCNKELAEKESCTIIVSFEPIEDRTHSSTIELSFFDYESEQSTSINISGQSLDIVAKMFFNGILSADFGVVVEGSEVVRTVNIRNEGFANATTLSFVFSQSDFYLKDNRCPLIIQPTEQCEIDIAYLPSSPNYGVQSSTLVINYNNSKAMDVSSSISLTGNARKIASLKTEDFDNPGSDLTSFNYGSKGQNSKTKKIITLVADSTVLTTATDITLSSISAPFSISNTTCSDYLAPGKKCNIEVIYSPTNLGIHNETLNISYNNGSGVQNISFGLQGSSESRGLLRISDLNEFIPHISLAPRPIGGTFEYTYTLINDGLVTSSNIVPATLPSQIVYHGGFPGNGGTCPSSTPFSLAPGASCTFSIRYTPTIPENILSETFNFTFNDGTQAQIYEFTMAREARFPANIIVSEDSGATVITETDYGDSSVTNKYIKKVVLYNDGGFAAQNISYTFSNADFTLNGAIPTLGPKSEEGNCPEVGQNLEAGESCSIYISFTPSSIATYIETFDVNYDNELISTTFNHTVKGVGANIAYLDITPNDQDSGTFIFPEAAYPGGKSSQLFTIDNKGQASATSFTVSNIIAPFSIGPATTCGSTVIASTTCQVEVEFSPTSLSFANLVPTFSYNNGSDTINYFLAIRGRGVSPSDLQVTIPLEPPYTFEDVEINTTKNLNITLTNRGSFPAQVSTVTSSNPYITITSENCTTDDINGFLSCSLSLQFAPDDTIVGNNENSTVDVNYYDGVTTQILSFTVEGLASPPRSTHQGWKQILALGNNVNSLGTNSNDRSVTLEWEPMIVTQAYPIDSYNVYRKLPTDEEFDYTTPIATGILPSQNKYSDTSIDERKRYIYEVRPVVLGNVSEVVEDISSVEVYIPPENMSFIHRRIANKILCQNMGKAINSTDNNSCFYNGPGSNVDGKLDIGFHLLYDRYELGQSNTSNPGQLPKTSFTQTSIDAVCSTQAILVDDAFKSKRVPSRKEYHIASTWPTGASVDTIEDGVISSENCNSSSTSLENNDSNSSCVSQFGIFNLVGNAWEIVSERLISGIGVTEAVNKLYPENTDFDGLDFTGLASGNISSFICLNVALGHPVEDNAGSCPEGAILVSSTTINNDYFWNPSSFGASFAQSFVGGSYEASTNSGRYTTAWVGASFSGGGRCVLEVESGLKFPEEE